MSNEKQNTNNQNAKNPAQSAGSNSNDFMKRIIAGVLILVAFWCVFCTNMTVWVGFVLMVVATGFLWKKTETIGPKAKDLKPTEWKPADDETIKKAKSKFQDVEKAKKGRMGCWIIIPIALVAIVIAVWAVPKDNNSSKALSTESNVVVQSDEQEIEKLIPHGWNKNNKSSEKDEDDFAEKALFFVVSICLVAYAVFCTGGVDFFKNEKLMRAIKQQEKIKAKGDWYPDRSMEMATVAKIPLDLKTTLKNKNINPDFLGIQVQTNTNKGPNGECPYTYCVILAKTAYDLIGKFNSVKKDINQVKGNCVVSDETKKGQDVSVIVVRKNGYETSPAEVEKTVDIAVKIMELIDAGKTEF